MNALKKNVKFCNLVNARNVFSHTNMSEKNLIIFAHECLSSQVRLCRFALNVSAFHNRK